MLERLKNWLEERFSDGAPHETPALRQSGTHRIPPRVPAQAAPRQDPEKASRPEPENVDFDSQVSGKNILVRNKYIREETGTYETLKIVDESLDDSEDGFRDDPYNTGGFDRSKNWGNRFRK